MPYRGIPLGVLDARYLRLDCTNDPLTAGLQINAATLTEPALILRTTDNNATNPIQVWQSSAGASLATVDKNGVLSLLGSTNTIQMIVRANSAQANTNPLIELQKSDGTQIGKIHTDHRTNFFVGYQAGQSNVVGAGNLGQYNIFIGPYSGMSNTSGYFNVGIGGSTLVSNTSGYENFAIGAGALYSNTNGYGNFGLGMNALNACTTADYNCAMGRSALSALTTADWNVGVGTSAGGGAVSGQRNTGVGGAALYSNTGQGNVGIGYSALWNNTADYNVAIGYCAGWTNTSGSGQTMIGKSANFFNATGANNTIVGHEAGYGVGAHNKSGCVLIGYQAGFADHNSNRLYIANSNTATPLIYGEFNNLLVKVYNYLYLPNIRSGATQAAAGASAGELWKTTGHATLPDNVVMIGV